MRAGKVLLVLSPDPFRKTLSALNWNYAFEVGAVDVQRPTAGLVQLYGAWEPCLNHQRSPPTALKLSLLVTSASLVVVVL